MLFGIAPQGPTGGAAGCDVLRLFAISSMLERPEILIFSGGILQI
jgi:hypothetical protein